MPLARKRVTIPLAGGLNTAEDPKVQTRGNTVMENGIVQVEHEIRKRHGTEVISGSYSETHLTSYKEKPVLFEDAYTAELRVYDGTDQENGEFNDVGEVYFSDAEVFPHVSPHRVDNVCSAEADDVRLVVYQEVYTTPGGAGTLTTRGCIRTFHRVTGELLDSTDIAAGPDMRCIWTGNKLRYFYMNTGTGVISYGEVNTTTGVIGGATALNAGAAVCDPDHNYDLCALGDGNDTTLLAMCHPAGGDVRVYTLEDDGTEHDSGAIAATDAVRVGCFKHVTGRAAVCWHDSGVAPNIVLCGFYLADATQHTAPVTVWTDTGGEDVYGITGAHVDANTVQIFMTVHTARLVGQHTYHVDQVSCSTATGSGVSALWAEGFILAAHAFIVSGTIYLPVMCELAGNDQRSYIIARRDKVAVARALIGRAVHPVCTTYTGPTGPCVLAPADGESGTWRHGLPRRCTDAAVGAAMVEWTISDMPTPNAWETDKHLVFNGSLPQVFDGQHVTEMGFLWYPPEINCANGAAAGSTPAADVRYRAVYEAFDSYGGRWISRACPEKLFTKAANTAVRVTVPSLGLTRFLDVRVVLYRTVDNGNVFYRVKDAANDPTAASVSFDDNWSDWDNVNSVDNVVNNERLYQQAEYPNLPMWGFRAACVHEDRLFYVPNEQPSEVWYTKPFRRGRGIEDPARFRIKVDPSGGDILALKSFKGRLVIFKRHRVFYCYGDGYSPNGAGSNLTTPALITNVGGCTDQRTIVELDDRLAFLGPDGLAGVNAKFQYEPNFGEDVRFQVEEDSVIPTRGVLVPDLGLAVWTSPSSATWVVYDIHRQRWMTWRAYQVADCVVSFNGYLYTKLQGSGNLYVEDRDNHEDGGSGGSEYTMKVRTPWINLADLAGYAKLWKLYVVGQVLADSTMKVKVAYDHVPHFVDDIECEFDVANAIDPDEHYKAGIAAGFLDKELLVVCAPSRQNCTAIMVQVEDDGLAAAALVNSFTLTAIVLEYGVKKGLRPMGPSRIGS